MSKKKREAASGRGMDVLQLVAIGIIVLAVAFIVWLIFLSGRSGDQKR